MIATIFLCDWLQNNSDWLQHDCVLYLFLCFITCTLRFCFWTKETSIWWSISIGKNDDLFVVLSFLTRIVEIGSLAAFAFTFSQSIPRVYIFMRESTINPIIWQWLYDYWLYFIFQPKISRFLSHFSDTVSIWWILSLMKLFHNIHLLKGQWIWDTLLYLQLKNFLISIAVCWMPQVKVI